MPALQQAAFLDRHALQDWAPLLEEVRAGGFCLRPSKDLAGGWVLSAPLRDADGLPYGALCTYGFCNALPEDFETKAAHTIREASLELSRWPYPALAARARRILAEAAA